jgi:hypothetical protein
MLVQSEFGEGAAGGGLEQDTPNATVTAAVTRENLLINPYSSELLLAFLTASRFKASNSA